MATSQWSIPGVDEDPQEQPLASFFSAMGLPAPTNYQPDSGMFEQLMSNLGGFNPPTAPTRPTQPPAPAPAPAPAPPAEGEAPATTPNAPFSPGPSGALQPSDAWGPYTEFGLPIPAGADLSSSAFWAQGADALAPLSNFYNIMGPWLNRAQQSYESSRDFNESSERFDRQQDWTEYMDSFSTALQGRQQNVAENDRATNLWQWMETFARQGQNDSFSQGMSIQNLLLNLARLEQEGRNANLQAYGRASAPARWSAGWG